MTKEDDVIDADSHGPICLGTARGMPTDHMDEDCLFMDVYAPSHATPHSKLPVYFFIQGGGFNDNSNANYNASGLIIAGDLGMVVVTFNYRVGPYGFLASREVQKGGSINNGLKDQRLALHWVQQYIAEFGGDPDQVTMGGVSAGAQSVTLHLTAYGGRDDKLFVRTTSESQSFSALRSVAETQYAYDSLVQRAGCDDGKDTLACLRSLSAAELQAVNIKTPFPGATDPPLYPYGPVLDDDFITDYTYRAYAQGKFVALPAIYGDDTNEGTIFAPNQTKSYSDTSEFLQDNFPALNNDQAHMINNLYPVEGTPSFPNTGRFWRQAANAYGELRYICPGIFISRQYAEMNLTRSWNYRWNVLDPHDEATGLGVDHTVELNAIWGPENVNGGAPTSYEPGGTNNDMVAIVQGYWTSFIRTGDPNTYRCEGSPTWQAWTSQNDYARLKFETDAMEMEVVPDDQQERCKYLWSIALSLEQ